jgi:hypothetical protein
VGRVAGRRESDGPFGLFPEVPGVEQAEFDEAGFDGSLVLWVVWMVWV